MLIAEKMGLSRSETAQLGVAALFHDVGKTHVPQSILNKPGTLTDDEWLLMERHPMLGVIELSRVRSLRAVIDPIFIALQHHLGYNGRGYPEKPGGWVFHPYTQIVTVADVYDAMSTPRIYRKVTLTPDRVLNFILHKSGDLFDPLIAKAFIRAMGVYPTGTVVDLNTGERAVVIRQNGDTRFLHRPVVVLLGEDGPKGDAVDLARQDDGGGPCRRTIVSSVHDHDSEAQKATCFVIK
jgi:HD-GYP domain-containing protein (c-di-GMP phosphodiesterase class II)